LSARHDAWFLRWAGLLAAGLLCAGLVAACTNAPAATPKVAPPVAAAQSTGTFQPATVLTATPGLSATLPAGLPPVTGTVAGVLTTPLVASPVTATVGITETLNEATPAVIGTALPDALPPVAQQSTQTRLAAGRQLQAEGDCAAARQEFAALLPPPGADVAEPTPPATAAAPTAAVSTTAVSATATTTNTAPTAALTATATPTPGTPTPVPADISEARYRLAQCYLTDDAPAEAAAVLGQLLKTANPTDPFRAPATFLLAEAQGDLADWNAAEANYTAYLKLAPELNAFTWQRIGNVRRSAGNLAGASQAYNQALAVSPDWNTTVSLRRALAAVALQQKDGTGAAAQFDALRGTLTQGSFAAEMYWLAGSAFNQAGDKASAQQRWLAAANADPTTTYAHQAAIALLDAGGTLDEYLRGVIDYNNDAYQLALDAFDRLRKTDPTGHQGDAWYYTGLSYLALGETNEGLAELGNLIAAYPGNQYWTAAWLAKARAYTRVDDIASAIATYRQFAAAKPDAPQAPTALYQAANLEAQNGSLATAATAYLALARRYPGADEGWRSYLAAGLAYYRQNNWRQAGEIWTEMTNNAGLPAWTHAVSYYWLGRAQLALGETQAAGHSWQTAWSAGPSSYYGLRAADWAAQVKMPVSTPTPIPPPAATATFVPTAAVPITRTETVSGTAAAPTATASPMPAPGDGPTDEITAWLRTWAGAGSLALPDSVKTDTDWRRGEMLLTLGQRGPALEAWGRVQQRHQDEPWTQAALAQAFADAGAPRLSIVCAEQVAALGPGNDIGDAPPALQRLAYPMAFEDLIRTQAGHWGIDPRLVAAVIRQESRFETEATSYAAAQGLMQIIPDTATWVAQQLGWPDFTPGQIYRPYVNITFGAYYLQYVLNYFDNSVPTALAGYNAGPGNAAIWRKLTADDDLMAALIDIPETRLYVQVVWQQYEMYRRLYR
jgi:soluble lytic murein transglycosylase